MWGPDGEPDGDGPEPDDAGPSEADLLITQCRAKRVNAGVPPSHYTGAMDQSGVEVTAPATYAEAMASPYAVQWQAAMEELASLRRRARGLRSPRAQGARAMGVKWVKTAFLNGDLEEEIFVEQPPGFAIGGRDNL